MTDAVAQGKEEAERKKEIQHPKLYGQVLNENEGCVGSGQPMYQRQKTGVSYWPYADDIIVGSRIDIRVAVGKITGKRVAKFENDKLNKNTCRCYEQVFFIEIIFYQEP